MALFSAATFCISLCQPGKAKSPVKVDPPCGGSFLGL